MVNSLLMFDALGYADSDIERPHGTGLDRKIANGQGRRGLLPTLPFAGLGYGARRPHAARSGRPGWRSGAPSSCLEWLRPLQVLDTVGDWAAARPGLRPGGWAFQYANPHYPDLDDTAVVVMAMDRASARMPHKTHGAFEEAIDARAGMGRWHAERATAAGPRSMPTTNITISTKFPSPTTARLLDPPTADVTARCVSMLAQLGARRGENKALDKAIAYLLSTQEEDGSWYGRWGMNYIYGTWSVLCALNAAGFDAASPEVRKAVQWLGSIQNPDGGWGEGGESYKLDYQGLRACAKHGFANVLGTAWAYGRRRGRPSFGQQGRRLSSGRAGGGRVLGGAALHRDRLSHASSTFAITATRNSSRFGRLPATAI